MVRCHTHRYSLASLPDNCFPELTAHTNKRRMSRFETLDRVAASQTCGKALIFFPISQLKL